MFTDNETANTTLKPDRERPREGTQFAIILKFQKETEVGIDIMMREDRCGATHSAIATLRSRYGLNIKNRKERVCHSFYRLKQV